MYTDISFLQHSFWDLHFEMGAMKILDVFIIKNTKHIGLAYVLGVIFTWFTA